jgi:hypothetical protein
VKYSMLTPESARQMAGNLRQVDIDECRAIWNLTPAAALRRCLQSNGSRVFASIGGNPVVAFGVHAVPSEFIGVTEGNPWLLGTRHLEENWVTFLRESRRWLKMMDTDYTILWNYIDARNTTTIRWLEWLGFQIGDAPEMRVEGTHVLKFMRYNPCVSPLLLPRSRMSERG